MSVAALDPLLSDEGWAYASLPPQEPGDPGRFHALFGRDSLITSLQVLPARPDVAAATLRALAALQGRAEDADTDEEPGKILHEHRPQAPERMIVDGWPVRDGELLYYGSADSTTWFLVVLAALGDEGLTAELELAWRAAAGWLERTLERGGGPVRYGPRDRSGGLAQQGWRDAMAPVDAHPDGGGILRPDGSTPRPPQADADVQAAAYAALRALRVLSREEVWERRAEALAAPDRARLRAWDHGARGRRPRGGGPRLPARLAAVVGRPVGDGTRGSRRAALRARHPHALRAAYAVQREPGVRTPGLSPRRDLALRFLAGLERPARRGP
jgi:glycogen debranching enzyme